MGRSLPKGDRVTVKITVGGVFGLLKRDEYCFVKKSTADYFGMKPLENVVGKRKKKRYGSIDTKSYILYLTSAEIVGGVSVVSLSFPVPASVLVIEAIPFFKNLSGKIAGLRSPDGRVTNWQNKARRGGSFKLPGGGSVPLLPGGGGNQSPIDKANRFIDDAQRFADQAEPIIKTGYEVYKFLDNLPIPLPL